jgi:hypothetical protein
MQDHYTQIQFIAANYSKLQGLRLVPIGLSVTSIALWTIDHQGDLGLPIISALGCALLYWLVDYYYVNTFGRIRQIKKMQAWEVAISVLSSVLAWLAFWLDMARDLPFSAFGLVFAAVLFEEIWRTAHSVKERLIRLYPENFTVACLIVILSLLPLTGLAWWKILGFPSQFIGMLTIVGILLILAGIWGHIRFLRILPAREAKPDENTL